MSQASYFGLVERSVDIAMKEASSYFKLHIDVTAREALIDQAGLEGEQLLADQIASGVITEADITKALLSLLEEGEAIAFEQKSLSVTAQEMQLAMNRKCPMKPWC